MTRCFAILQGANIQSLIVAVSINGIGLTVVEFNRASDFLANSKSAFGVLG